MSCVSNAFASVHCCLVVTCWERADFLAFVGDVNCIFVTFPCGILGQVWYLIVSFPDSCCFSYFDKDKSVIYYLRGSYTWMLAYATLWLLLNSLLDFFQLKKNAKNLNLFRFLGSVVLKSVESNIKSCHIYFFSYIYIYIYILL